MRLRSLSLLLVFATALPCSAAVKLPSIIGDNMVLQRDQAVPIWGWDDAGAQVSVTIGDHTAKTIADDDGRWQVELPKMKAGGPHEIVVKGSTTETIENVLFGEVWLCSGQSNMEWRVKQSSNAAEEIAAAQHPTIRHIKIPHRPSDKPESDVPSDGWQVCSPDTVAEFTGVGYFFGRHLSKELDVPIGLIGSNWGGTRIEPWTPPEGFKAVPELKEIADKLDTFPQKNGEKINHQSPLALYNGMISPLLPYTIRGAIWYQGESNRGDGLAYEAKMHALIKGWRKLWHNDELPFYYVQLAPYRYRGNDPDLLPLIWEAQTNVLKMPHTGMAVTVDITTVNNIHPPNKQDVGKRLALWALAETYGQKDLVYSGPLYSGMKAEGGAVHLSFDHVGGGLVSRDDKPLTHFEVRGEEGEWVAAEAKIDGDEVVVSAADVAKPVAVRYAWDQLAEPNLSNAEGLPASPFRTDGGK